MDGRRKNNEWKRRKFEIFICCQRPLTITITITILEPNLLRKYLLNYDGDFRSLLTLSASLVVVMKQKTFGGLLIYCIFWFCFYLWTVWDLNLNLKLFTPYYFKLKKHENWIIWRRTFLTNIYISFPLESISFHFIHA